MTTSAANAQASSRWPEVRAHLDQMVEALRRAGITDPVEGLEQIAQLLYLQRLDDREPRSGSRIFVGVMTSRFRWSRLRACRGPELRRMVEEALFYMASLVNEAPQVADYFRDPVLKIEDPAALEAIVDRIDQIDMAHLRPDEMGRILEHLIARTNPSGEFRTPHHVRALMVEAVDPADGETIYDPACGTGGFLTDAVQYLLAKYSSAPREIPIYGEGWRSEGGSDRLQMWKVAGGASLPRLPRDEIGCRIFGHDISRRMLRIAAMNLELLGIGPVSLRRTNSLTASGAGLTPVELSRRYDVILCAPTFGPASSEPVRPDLPIPSMRSEVLFVEVAMQCLTPGGRAAILVPDSLLSGQGSAFVELRRKLLSDGALLAVISLPVGVLRSASAVKMSILVMRKPRAAEEPRSHVWFYDVERDGFDLDGRETPQENDIPDLQRAWDQYRASEFGSPPGLATGSVYEGVDRPRCWWANRETIAGNSYNLTVSSYAPRRDALSIVSIEEQAQRLRSAYEVTLQSVGDMQALLGALPRGWRNTARVEKLSNLVEAPISGTTPKRDNPSYWGDGVAWVSPKDMKSPVIESTEERVTQRAVNETSLRVMQPGALLLVVRSMILVRHVPIAVNEIPVTVNQDLRVLVPREESGIDVWFLFAYLRSVEDVLLAHTRVTGNGGRALPQQVILDLDVPIPPVAVMGEVGRFVRTYLSMVRGLAALQQSALEVFPAALAGIFRGGAHARHGVN